MNAKRLMGVLAASGLVSLVVAIAAAGHTATGSGDACTASGNGTSYSLSIDVASTDPEQYGFAIGAQGASVRNIAVPGGEGSFLSQSPPAGASGSWLSTTRLTPGTVAVTVATSGPTRSFTILPASSASPATYFDPIACKVTAAPSAPKAGSFTVVPRAVYDASEKDWRLVVTIAGAGRVTATQPEPTVGTAYPKSSTAKSLLQARGVGLKTPGTVTLHLRATALGQSMLSSAGRIKAKMLITFFPSGGKATSKLVSLVLKQP